MGDSISEGSIGSWNKKVGDWIENEEVIAVIETDKVSIEIHAPTAGTLKSVSAQEGETVEVGAPLCEIDDDPSAKPNKASSSAQKSGATTHSESNNKSVSSATHNLSDKHGMSDKAKDAQHHSNQHQSSDKQNDAQHRSNQHQSSDNKSETSSSGDSKVPTNPPPKRKAPSSGERVDKREPMSRLRQRVAERLKHAQNTAASLTTFNEVDMSALMALRQECGKDVQDTHGVKLGFVSAFLCAASRALMRAPEMNAHITENGNEVVYKNYADISVAVAAPHGLLVPVVRDCHVKTMPELEEELRDLATRARAGKIALEEMVGGTLTISNGGVFGSLFGTPILNPPQASILGLHAIKERAVVLPSGEIVARPIMFLALTYDHRLVDGREAVLFLEDIRKQIEDPRRMLLDI